MLGELQQALDGRYAVEREVGHGGMATVYLARDVKPRFFSMTLPDSALFVPGRDGFDEVGRGVAISRDGKSIVYSAQHGNGTRLMLARLDRGEITPVRGTEGAVAPGFRQTVARWYLSPLRMNSDAFRSTMVR